MSRPPRLTRALLTLLLPREDAEFVLGDMEEVYRRRVVAGRLRARVWYWRAAVSAVLRMRRVERTRWWAGLALDARASVRSLRRTPSFTAVASGTLALGLGVTIAVYAMADRLMLQPARGVHDAERAVFIDFTDPAGGSGAYLSPADLADFRAATESTLEHVAAATWTRVHIAADGAEPVMAQAAFVDGPYFELLGVRAREGRLPRGEELSVEAPAIVVLGERLRARIFTRDEAVIGSVLRISGHPFTVVGVVADGFAGLERETPADLWLPVSAAIPVIGFERDRLLGRQASLYPHLVARLRVGVDAQSAAAALRLAVSRIASGLPAEASTLGGQEPRVHPGIAVPPDARTRTGESLRVLAFVVALVLVVTCANVTNLLLFRTLRARRDVVVRRALGASRARIVVQQLIGNGLLAVLALAAAFVVAWGVTRLFAGHKLLGIPAFDALAPDGRLLAFAFAAAAASTLLAGALPAWVASRAGGSAMSANARTHRGSARHDALRRVMTVIQLTASLALIVGALLLVRAVRGLHAVDPGFTMAGVHAIPLNFPGTLSSEESTALFERAEAAARTQPGVDRVALDIAGPFVSRLRGPVVPAGSGGQDRTSGIVSYVTPAFFDLLDVRIVRGRAFDGSDRTAAGMTHVILSEGLARTLFGSEDPIGRSIQAFGRRNQVEVIGVAEDIRYADILSEPEPIVYHPWVRPFQLGTTVLLVRVSERAAPSTAAAVRDAVARAVPELALERPISLEARRDEQLAEHRLFARLLTFLSLLAAVLAGVGLYAVVGYGVADRAREFGIRMALGAPAHGVARLVVRQTLLTIAVGTVFGLAAAVVLARGIAHRLSGVGVLDAPTAALAVLALALIGVTACIGPVRSATTIDPMRVLREE